MGVNVPKHIPFWQRVVIFLSSISLLFFAVTTGCSVNFIGGICSGEKPFFSQPWHWLFSIFAIVGVLGAFYPVYFVRRCRDRNTACGEVVKLNDDSSQAVAHAVLYLSLFIAHDCSFNQYIWLLFFILIITPLYCLTNNFSLNPVFLLMGYQFLTTEIKFDDSPEPKKFLLVSKREISVGDSVTIWRWSNQSLALVEDANGRTRN